MSASESTCLHDRRTTKLLSEPCSRYNNDLLKTRNVHFLGKVSVPRFLLYRSVRQKAVHNVVADNLHKTGTTFVTLEEN